MKERMKLLELKDGYIYDIEDEFDRYVTGCPTCGLDDEYISSITFKGKFNEELKSININSSGFLEFEFTVSDILKLVLNNIVEIKNMTQEEWDEIKNNIWRYFR